MAESKNMQPLVHALINILFFLGEGSALLRLYTKLFVLKNFGWDDWSMLLVSVVNIGQHIILYTFIQVGAGLPQADVLAQDPTALNKMLKRLFVEEIWYLGLHFLIKMSFLLFFLRLSPSSKFRIAVFCVIGANVFVTVGTWVLYCLQCIPLEAYWHPEKYPDVKCLPFAVSLWLPATALICVDWAIFILPLSTILSLQMTMKKRLQVLAVVCTGGASVLVSCLRLIVIHEFTVTTDFIYTVGSICIVSAAEMEVAILAANMPGMSALYKAWKSGTISGTGRTSGGGTGSYGPQSRTKNPSGKGYINTGDGSGNGDGHQLATFSSKRTRERIVGDEDLMYTRYENERGAPGVDSDARTLGDHSSTRELAPGRKDSDDDSEGPGHGTNRMSGAQQNHGVVVSREIVVTDEPRDAGRGAQGPEGGLYRPHTWKVAGRSFYRP
ncbi:uncharacterized protein B0I36DRAFT_366783 [Microdochium trichocladiopsis]|uniref:Rhodopsin domain-containing protein n=1 Tax=Microdochium trichocladiopsis TaxID=1682393 RepID=A0A9P9BLG9_9PEZI|nr:uncharacterized protein B0I36DRAFT_366783 [Microdochium trichocladiopsis]KAH7024879.1 hypothetical protein B0I36DRAFT_366783 [Microdochium trichocladiopsis]